LQYNFFVLPLFVALEVAGPAVLELLLSVVVPVPEPVELVLFEPFRSVLASVLSAIM
jgi:hypothetical protein